MSGELFLRDVSELDEDAPFLERDGLPRLLRARDTPSLDIHASREARWHPVDLAGTRPVVVLCVLRRLLLLNGFSARLVWGRPDMRRRVFRSPRPAGCELERPAMLRRSDLRSLGLDRPSAEPLMGDWAGSPCHVALVDSSLAAEPWVHGWDARHPALLAQLFVEWEISGDDGSSFFDLHSALSGYGPLAVVMYLLGSRYSDLLGPADLGLSRALHHVRRIRSTLADLHPGPSPPELGFHRLAFLEALCDDLDTPNAFLCLFDWIREARSLPGPVGDQDLRTMLWLLAMGPSPTARASSSKRSLSAATRRPRKA